MEALRYRDRYMIRHQNSGEALWIKGLVLHKRKMPINRLKMELTKMRLLSIQTMKMRTAC